MFIFLLGGFIIKAFGSQDPDSLFKQKKFLLSSLEYERKAFEAKSEEEKSIYLFKKSLCFENLKDYKRASEEINRINLYLLNDSLSNIVLYKSALYDYFNKEFAIGENKLKEGINIFSSIDIYKYWLLILCLNEQYRWKESSEYLMRFQGQLTDTNGFFKISQKFNFSNYPKIKSPEKAERLNTFLPGLGFLYTKNIAEGLVSTGLILGSLAVTAWGIYSTYYVTAILGGFQLSQMFYMGGTRRAEYLARKYNYEKSIKFNTEIRALFEEIILKQ
jgi:hypothetical protein